MHKISLTKFCQGNYRSKHDSSIQKATNLFSYQLSQDPKSWTKNWKKWRSVAPLLVIKATKILRMRPALFRPNDSLRTTRTQVQPSLLIFLLSLYSTHRGHDHFSYVSFFLVFLVTRFFCMESRNECKQGSNEKSIFIPILERLQSCLPRNSLNGDRESSYIQWFMKLIMLLENLAN